MRTIVLGHEFFPAELIVLGHDMPFVSLGSSSELIVLGHEVIPRAVVRSVV